MTSKLDKEAVLDDLLSSNAAISKVLKGLPIKWVVRVCNACIVGSDYTNSLKTDCLRDLARWHVLGKTSGWAHLANETRGYRWHFLRNQVVRQQRDYARWLTHKAERATERADRIQEKLRTDGSKDA